MLKVGSRIGDYEILDIIQSSKKEVVYKVNNTAAKRIETMKVLSESSQKDMESLERFMREIRLHAKLQHPNIVAFYNATQLNGVAVMTMEFVEGVTLEEKLGHGPIPLPKAVAWLTQVLAALEHAHTNQILHREVTPEHIIILPDDTVKLGGFGLAKAKGDLSLTQVGTTLGAVAYMSPEQVKGRADIDFRTDIYSAGLVFWETVAGRKPFQTASDFEMMLAHVQRDIPLIASVNRSLPAALDQVLQKALAKNPAERFPTAHSFAMALSDFRDGSRVVAYAVSDSKPKITPIAPPPMPKPAVAAAGHVAAAKSAQRNDQILTALLGLALLVIVFWTVTLFVK